MRNLPLIFLAASIAAGFSIALASAASATERRATYVGRARVVDGDTLAIGNDRLRLWGVDAPEIRQQCLRNGQAFLCGEHVAEALRTYIGRDHVRCDFRDWNPARALDHDDRAVVRCTVRGVDLADWLTSRGLAVPYFVGNYRSSAMRACEARLGLWAGSFARPSSYRRQGDFTSDVMGVETRRPCGRSLNRL